jgi:hypothetical protein
VDEAPGRIEHMFDARCWVRCLSRGSGAAIM